MFRRSKADALAGLKRTPRSASGISAGITSALNTSAASTAFDGLDRCMTSSAFICGIAATKIAGRIAKYFDTSFASENDPQKPFVTSGIRLGSPAFTTRGFKEEDATIVGNLIADILDNPNDAAVLERVKAEVKKLTDKYPVYAA